MNGATAGAPAGFPRGAIGSIETPTISRPWLRYFSWSWMKLGISIRHGPHHVAQKSTITTLPRNASRLCWTSSVTAGVEEIASGLLPLLQPESITAPASNSAITGAIAIIIGLLITRPALPIFCDIVQEPHS